MEYHHLLVKARKFLGAVTAIENYELEKYSILSEILDEETILNVPKKKIKLIKEEPEKIKTKTKTKIVFPTMKENETEKEYRQRCFELL